MTSEPLPTRGWTAAELAELDRSPLIRVAGARADGTLRRFVLIGHVRIGDDERIRSLNGSGGAWYRGATRTWHGEIDVDGRRITRGEFDDLAVQRGLVQGFGDEGRDVVASGVSVLDCKARGHMSVSELVT